MTVTSTRTILKIALTAAVAGLFVLSLACSRHPRKAEEPAQASPTPQSSNGAFEIVNPAESKPVQDLKFNHNRTEHKQQKCELCHLRSNNDPTPVLPGHPACIACHGKDFTSTTSKLCIVCHQTPLADKPKLAAFPAQLIQFGIRSFSHKTHLDPSKMPSGASVPRCDSCHKFDSTLLVANNGSHPDCYSCHTHEAGQKLGNCQTCHADKSEAMKVAQGPGTAFALYRFSHGGHFRQASISRSCDKCHRVLQAEPKPQTADIFSINTARGQRHSSACWTCHVQAKEPVCTKCHVGGPPVL